MHIVPHPAPPTPILRPRLEPALGLTDLSRWGGGTWQTWVGRQWRGDEGGCGQGHKPGAEEKQEPLGEKTPSKTSHMCKLGRLPDQPRPPSLSSISATHPSELSSMPWKLVGSLSLKEFQAHLAWAFPDDRRGGTSFQAPQGPSTQFSSVELGRFLQSPFLGLRTWSSGRDVT